MVFLKFFCGIFPGNTLEDFFPLLLIFGILNFLISPKHFKIIRTFPSPWMLVHKICNIIDTAIDYDPDII